MKLRTLITTAAILALVQPLAAQNDQQPGATDERQRIAQAESPEPDDQRLVDLEALVRDVAAAEGLEFLIDPRARRVFVAGTPIENPSYADLLAILRLNGFSAVEIGGRLNIIPSPAIRSHALPLVQRDDPSIPDDAWVTRVITVGRGNSADGIPTAARLVPILRPLLPQMAHFAADGETKLIVVDRYANVRRITELVRELTD